MPVSGAGNTPHVVHWRKTRMGLLWFVIISRTSQYSRKSPRTADVCWKHKTTPVGRTFDSVCGSSQSKPQYNISTALCLRPRRHDSPCLVPHGRILPSVEKLKLDECEWAWSLSETSTLLDLSKLRYLSLRWSGSQESILDVPTKKLTGLQTFKYQHRLYVYYESEVY